MAMGGTLFEELGFYYVGPIDGHNLDQLIPVLENVRDAAEGPCLVHVVTQKGKGYAPAENSADKYHGVQKFDVITGEQAKSAAGPPSYTERVRRGAAGRSRARRHDLRDHRGDAERAPGSTSSPRRYPERAFDVGIAEQHAVTFAAGLAAQGMRPFCAIYSTFLQRAYDQVVHDVAIQNLPVRFAIDRAGLVGADGATHAGSFDVTYLATLPNFVVMAAADEAELVHMTHTAALHDSGPIAFRYPRGNGTGVALPDDARAARDRQGPDRARRAAKVAILSLGTRLAEALKAADQLEAKGLSTTVADLRFAKPLDTELIRKLMTTHEVVVTVEEGRDRRPRRARADPGERRRPDRCRASRSAPCACPTLFQDHDAPDKQYDEAGLNAPHIVDTVLQRAAPQQRGGGGSAGLNGRGAAPAARDRRLAVRCWSPPIWP